MNNNAHKKTHSVILKNDQLADNFKSRFLGLMWRTILPETQLLLRRCNSVHTFGMKSEIDIFFLDDQDTIVSIRRSLKPYRFALKQSAKHCFETSPGLYPYGIGDTIQFNRSY